MEFLTLDEVAKKLKVSTKTVKRLVRRGELRCVLGRSIRRVTDEELERWARESTTGTTRTAPVPIVATTAPPYRVDLETIARRATGTSGPGSSSSSRRRERPRATS